MHLGPLGIRGHCQGVTVCCWKFRPQSKPGSAHLPESSRAWTHSSASSRWAGWRGRNTRWPVGASRHAWAREPWKSWAAGSSKAKPLETSLGSAQASDSPGGFCCGNSPRASPPPSPLQGGLKGLRQGMRRELWGVGHSKAALGSGIQPRAPASYPGFVPLFYSQPLLLPEWRRLGGSTAPGAANKPQKQRLGKHSVASVGGRASLSSAGRRAPGSFPAPLLLCGKHCGDRGQGGAGRNLSQALKGSQLGQPSQLLAPARNST